MQLVAARFRRHHHLPARRVAILRRVYAGQQIELLNRVNRRPEVRNRLRVVVVIKTVQREIIAAFARTGHVETAAIAQPRALHRRHHVRREHRQREEGAAVQRHLHYACVVHHRAQLRGFSIDHFPTRGYGDALGGIAQFQSQVQTRALRHRQHQVGAGHRLEPGGRNADIVAARRNEGKLIGASAIGIGRAHHTLLTADQLYRCLRQHSAGRICHRACQIRLLLSQQRSGNH